EAIAGLPRDDYFRPFLSMLGSIEAGDTVIIQPNDRTIAHFGELSAETGKLRGGTGVVIDGGGRDVDDVARLGFPCFACYTTPQDIVGRWRLNNINVPITIGETTIQAGDYVVGDRDGVLIIPQEVAEEVIVRAEECIHTENQVRKAVL